MTDNTERPINPEAGRTPRPLTALVDALQSRGWRAVSSYGSRHRYRHPGSPGEELVVETDRSAAEYPELYDAVTARLNPLQASTRRARAGLAAAEADRTEVTVTRYVLLFTDGSRYEVEAAGYTIRQGWVRFASESEFAAPEAAVRLIERLPTSGSTDFHQVGSRPGQALQCIPGCTGRGEHLRGDQTWLTEAQAETVRLVREAMGEDGFSGSATGAVSAMTGLSAERLDELGGVPEDKAGGAGRDRPDGRVMS